MRDYSQFASTFWTGETGKKLRKNPNAQRLAAYLLTSPHSNAIGFYWLPLIYASNETGMSLDEIGDALQYLGSAEVDFAHYDHDAEFVFVTNMARVQLSLGQAPLEAKDNRLKAARKAAESASKSRLYPRFVSKWGRYFGIEPPKLDTLASPLQAPPEPPCKGLSTASEEQEQEQEQDIDPDSDESHGADAPVSGHGQAIAKSQDPVFAHWVAVMGKDPGRTKLTPDRKSKLKARRRDGYTDEQLCRAVDGCRLSGFHMGENERNEPYNDLATILRDGKTVEAHMARADAAGRRPDNTNGFPEHMRAGGGHDW